MNVSLMDGMGVSSVSPIFSGALSSKPLGSCSRRSQYGPCCSDVKTVFHMFHISPMLGPVWSL